jgi:hypothetical protein
MVGVTHKDDIYGAINKKRIVRGNLHSSDVVDAFLAQPLAQVVQHARFCINGIQHALWADSLSQSKGEIPTPSPNIRHNIPLLKIECLYHCIGLLPDITFGVFKPGDILLK